MVSGTNQLGVEVHRFRRAFGEFRLEIRYLAARCRKRGLGARRGKSQPGVSIADVRDGIRIGRRAEKVADRHRQLGPHAEYAETLPVQEFEMRVHLPQLFPQTEHAETTLAQIGGVKQHHRAPGQFRPPTREVAFDVVVGIPAVDMQ